MFAQEPAGESATKDSAAEPALPGNNKGNTIGTGKHNGMLTANAPAFTPAAGAPECKDECALLQEVKPEVPAAVAPDPADEEAAAVTPAAAAPAAVPVAAAPASSPSPAAEPVAVSAVHPAADDDAPDDKSSQELPPGIHKANRGKKHGACPRGGRVVRVHAVLQQLEGCVG